nr:hypothetical protein GCM10025730_01310 [Promicromonospora thailandica]
MAGDTEPGAELVESLTELTVEVVDDLYLRRYGNAPEPPPFDRACALKVATAAVEDPRAALADADPEDAVGSARVAFAREVRDEMERRKRRLGILSYDDLLGRLADALDPASGDGGAAVGARMRDRWAVVLVDEFQDTDPVQWQVLERAFGGAQGAPRVPWCWSATPSRPSTRFAAATSWPTSTPPGTPARVPRWAATGARTRPWSRPSRCCWATRRSATPRSWCTRWSRRAGRRAARAG